MKTSISILAFTALCLFGSQTLASSTIIQEVRAFSILADEAIWKGFMEGAEKAQAVIICKDSAGKGAKCLKGAYVADKATDYALTQESLRKLVPENSLNKKTYRELFMRYNNFTETQLVTLEAFRNLATGKIPDSAIFYPQDPEHLKQQAKVVPVIAVSANQEVVKPNLKPKPDVADEFGDYVADLKKQVTELSKRNSSNPNVTKQLVGLQRQLQKISSDLKKSNDLNVALNTQQQEINKEYHTLLSGIGEELKHLQALESKFSKLENDQANQFTQLWESISNLSLEGVRDELKLQNYWLLAVTLLLLATMFVVWRNRVFVKKGFIKQTDRSDYINDRVNAIASESIIEIIDSDKISRRHLSQLQLGVVEIVRIKLIESEAVIKLQIRLMEKDKNQFLSVKGICRNAGESNDEQRFPLGTDLGDVIIKAAKQKRLIGIDASVKAA